MTRVPPVPPVPPASDYVATTVLPPWAEAAQAHLLLADPPMAALVRRLGPTARTLATSEDRFSRLVRAIVGQQISGIAATAIYRRLVARAGDPLTPPVLAALPDEALRACGLSSNKLLSVRDLAQRALDGRLDLAHVATLPDEAVTAQLVSVRGIGRWTADMFLIFALGRPDVLPVGDLAIQQAVQRLYDLPQRPPPATIHDLAEAGRWHPYATAASFYLWESVVEAARSRIEPEGL